MLHYECYLVLQAIVQTVPLHEANEPFQLINMWLSEHSLKFIDANVHSQLSIQVPSSALMLPKPQIHDFCVLRCPVISEPRTIVAM